MVGHGIRLNVSVICCDCSNNSLEESFCCMYFHVFFLLNKSLLLHFKSHVVESCVPGKPGVGAGEPRSKS